MTPLEQQRQRINQLDEQLIPLLEERLTVATEIATAKARQHQPIYDSRREAVVYEHIQKQAEQQQLVPYLTEIYAAIMQATKKIEEDEQEDQHA
ncbi:chorismate mutase [Fructilactobacillus cliffordii]|uniref:Chorismate mutase n=1 Tax=Fructilactobacillus cliffordii TaxID=2940299 RepID=A0A9Q8ZTH4_9LACO|nr:chorismate mutase [Fructilactobacillus cliffordii]USS89145.1 chorismate mutase [Fructilactobacillus cliffordii]